MWAERKRRQSQQKSTETSACFGIKRLLQMGNCVLSSSIHLNINYVHTLTLSTARHHAETDFRSKKGSLDHPIAR